MSEAMPGENASLEEHDAKVHPHCPMLGGEVPFRYCRTLNDGNPCQRVETCWQGVFDIQGFLETHYDMEEIRALWDQPRKPKMLSILEILQKVQREQ